MSSMFKKLFKSNKKKTAQVSSKESIMQLADKEEELLKKQEYLEKQIQEQLQIAKTNSSSNKRLALQALKRKKNLEKQQKDLDGVLQTLEYQKSTLENASINAEVLQVIASTSKSIKVAHNGMDIDKVQTIMEDISEQYDIGRQIAEAISNPTHLDIDDDELMNELNQLEESVASEENLKIPSSSIAREKMPSKDALFPSQSKEKKGKLIAQMA